MIDILKGTGCHNCDVKTGPLYNITFNNLNKPLKLCEKCIIELHECLLDIIKTEGLLKGVRE